LGAQIRFEYGVFPHTGKNGVTIKWNAVIHCYEDEHRRKVIVMRPTNSPALAKAAALAWIKGRKP
jgi:hypothetical protein